MNAAITVNTLILDDHPLLQMGVKGVIDKMGFDSSVSLAGTLKEALAAVTGSEFDLIICDLCLPDADGIDAVKSLNKITSAPILVYSLKQEKLVAASCFKAGASAYVMKEGATDNLEKAIDSVVKGKPWCTPELASYLAQSIQLNSKKGVEHLSNRELIVFENLGRGHSIKEIAYKLELSPKTIESHRDRIKQKLNSPSTHELIVLACEWLKG